MSISNFHSIFFAFLRKDIKIALSYKFNLFVQLLAMLFAFSLLFFATRGHVEAQHTGEVAIQHLSFFKAIVGIALIDFMFSSMSVFSREVRSAQTFGTFEALIVTNTSILVILMSSFAMTFCRSMFRICIYVLAAKFIFSVKISLVNVPAFLLLIIFNTLPFIGVGLLTASFIILFKVGNLINFFVGSLSIFFSGIFFSTESLPNWLIAISHNLPLTIGSDLALLSLLGQTSFNQIYPELMKVLGMALISLPTGILLVYYALRVSKQNGSLNYY
mgnify:CR=1 FL=1